MSMRSGLPSLLEEIYSKLGSAGRKIKGANGYIEESYFCKTSYNAKGAIMDICSARASLDDARDACFWLEMELMEDDDE